MLHSTQLAERVLLALARKLIFLQLHLRDAFDVGPNR